MNTSPGNRNALSSFLLYPLIRFYEVRAILVFHERGMAEIAVEIRNMRHQLCMVSARHLILILLFVSSWRFLGHIHILKVHVEQDELIRPPNDVNDLILVLYFFKSSWSILMRYKASVSRRLFITLIYIDTPKVSTYYTREDNQVLHLIYKLGVPMFNRGEGYHAHL